MKEIIVLLLKLLVAVLLLALVVWFLWLPFLRTVTGDYNQTTWHNDTRHTPSTLIEYISIEK